MFGMSGKKKKKKIQLYSKVKWMFPKIDVEISQ